MPLQRWAQLLVRHLEDDVKAKLQLRARRHGRSTEEEVREILRNAVRDEDGSRAPLGSRNTQIAGIVQARKATLVTGNTRHFEGFGLVLVDPWAV